jgi:hypothetical protein
MRRLGSAAVLVIALMLSGCEGLDSFAAPSNSYTTSSYYGTPMYAAQGYYAQPYYAAPYGYQPGYMPPYAYGFPNAYGSPWGGRPSWREREWNRDQAFQNEGRQHFNRPSQVPNVPPVAAPPRSLPSAVSSQPPAAGAQATENRRLLDQLGFRPSR